MALRRAHRGPCGHLPGIHGRTLRAGLALVAVGNLMEVPFAVIRLGERLTWFASPVLADAAFHASTARFVMVPLGCAVAAFEPMRTALSYYHRRVRLYSLWRSLRDATAEIALGPPVSRWRDAMTFDNAWERLHRRVIEIRVSAFHLHDSWCRPELAEESTVYEETRYLLVLGRALRSPAVQAFAGAEVPGKAGVR